MSIAIIAATDSYFKTAGHSEIKVTIGSDTDLTRIERPRSL